MSVVVLAVLSACVTWWSGPLDGAVGARTGSLPSRLTPVTFAMRGVVPVAYAVFAVALGAVVGAVLRRSLLAMAFTLAMVVALQVVVPIWVRPHLMAPEDVTVAISAETFDGLGIGPGGGPETLSVHTSNRDDWILSNTTVDIDGNPAALPDWMGECLAAEPPAAAVTERVQAAPLDACLDRLAAAGYHQRIVYQPADRFWGLQLREATLLVALGGLLVGVAVWWTRSRLV